MFSLNNWCRTCGSKKSESKQLQEIGEFQDIVLLFTKVNDDSFPFNVCEECIASLNMIRTFADKCAITDSFFTDLLTSLEGVEDEGKSSNMVFKGNTSNNSTDSKSQTSVTSIINEFNLEPNKTEILETSPRTRSLRLRQKQHIESIHTNPKPIKALAVKREKDFSCDQCIKSFLSEKTLKNHQKKHLNKRKYDCTTCQKSFSNTSSLKSHLDTHSDTSYICPECGLKLNTKRTLRQHMLKHSDFKRFKCNICGSEFKRTKTFKEHLIIHSDLRPYSCMWCDKTFKSGANCRKHKKEAHPVELAESDASGVKIGVVLPKLEQLL